MKRTSSQINELEEASIGKLLATYALPTITQMVAIALFNLTDSYFVGQYCGAIAVSGLVIAFPIMILMSIPGVLLSVGASTVIARKLGAGEICQVKKIVGRSFIWGGISGVIVTIVLYTNLDSILQLFGASESTLPFARSYITPMIFAAVITQVVQILQGSQKIETPFTVLFIIIISFIINYALDYTLIVIYPMGIQGVSIATIFTQIIVLLCLLPLVIKRNQYIRFDFRPSKESKHLILEVVKTGISPCVISMASCTIAVLANIQMRNHGGDIAIGAYGIVNRINLVFYMIIMGLASGMQPIAGYNYGAQLMERTKKVFALTLKISMSVSLVALLIGTLFPEKAVSLFTNNIEQQILATKGLSIIIYSVPLSSLLLVSSYFLLSVNQIKKTMILTVYRQVVVIIPLLIVLPSFFGLNGVWLSFPIADVLVCSLSLYFIYKITTQFLVKSSHTTRA